MRNSRIQPMTNKEQTMMAVTKDMELSSWTRFPFSASINEQNGRGSRESCWAPFEKSVVGRLGILTRLLVHAGAAISRCRLLACYEANLIYISFDSSTVAAHSSRQPLTQRHILMSLTPRSCCRLGKHCLKRLPVSAAAIGEPFYVSPRQHINVTFSTQKLHMP